MAEDDRRRIKSKAREARGGKEEEEALCDKWKILTNEESQSEWGEWLVGGGRRGRLFIPGK